MLTEIMDRTAYSQDKFLGELSDKKDAVNIFLVNGIRLHGVIGGFDHETVLLESAVPQIVYKHAISTIMLAKA